MTENNSSICSKHGVEKTNFWSKYRGGVIHGCPLCDKDKDEVE